MGLNRELDRAEARRFLDEIEEFHGELKSAEDLANLIDKFREGIASGTWEFMGTVDFFAGLTMGVETLQGNCEMNNFPCPEPPDWRLIGYAIDRGMWMA